MAKNPFLKAEQKIIKMYRNNAKIHFVSVKKNYDPQTGNMTETKEEQVGLVYISEPAVISEAVADGKNYLIGDMTFDVSRLDLEMVLPESRIANNETCGVSMETDFVVIGEQIYRFVKFNPKGMWGGVPAKYRLQVRSGKVE